MKVITLVLLCLLVTTLYMFLQDIDSSLLPSSSSLSSSSLFGRRCKEDRVLTPSVKKWVPEERKIQEKSEEPQYESSTDSLDESVYHIDYHGVTTHPTPTPKHPAP